MRAGRPRQFPRGEGAARSTPPTPSSLFPSIPPRDVAKVQDLWFADTDAIKRMVGLVDAPPRACARSARAPALVRCGVCFDNVPAAATADAGCGHPYCAACWKGYVAAAISQGPAVLSLRCPTVGCGAAVPAALVRASASPADVSRYDAFATRSFVDDNRRAAWCPAPGCDAAAEAAPGAAVAGAPLDVACVCGEAFCFTCGAEAHRPVACATVRRWAVKNSAESENLNWILAHTKQCPKCRRPIEKNQGCMHMTW